MTVEELQSRISRLEVLEWLAYERRNGPLGPGRGDYHAALISKVVADSQSKKRSKLENFFFKWGVKRGGEQNEHFDH